MLTSGLSLGTVGAVTAALVWSHLSAGGSPAVAGVIAAALGAPIAIGVLAGGALVDRLGARGVLLVTNGLCALALLAACALLWLAPDRIVLVVAACALANLAGAPGGVAQDARVPELARLARVPAARANALRDVAAQVGQVGGPALGVLLVEASGLPLALAAAAAAASAAVIIDALLFPRFRIARAERGTSAPGGAVGALLADPTLRMVAVAGVLLVGVFSTLDELLAPALALATGRGGDALAGFLVLAGSSALVSAGTLAVLGPPRAPQRLLIAGLAACAAGLLALGLAPATLGFSLAPVLLGLGIGPIWPIVLTAVQRRVPTAARGTAIGLLAGASLAAQPAAALASGVAVASAGPQGVALVLAGAVGLLALAAGLSPALRDLGATRPR